MLGALETGDQIVFADFVEGLFDICNSLTKFKLI